MPKTPRIPWPPATGVDAVHQPCGSCSRCVSGTGRDLDETASDCWVEYLNTIAEYGRRSA